MYFVTGFVIPAPVPTAIAWRHEFEQHTQAFTLGFAFIDDTRQDMLHILAYINAPNSALHPVEVT